MTFHVLLTDFAWANTNIERSTLAAAGCELIVAEKAQQSAEGLAALAKQHQVDAIMTNWAKVPESVIAASGKVRIVSRLGIGLDNIDVAYCTKQKIPVTNVPDYCVIEVAEHALALLLALSRKIGFYHHACKQGNYVLQSGPTLRRIEGQTLGLVGMGNTASRLATKALGLGMKVVATSRSMQSPLPGVKMVSLDELLATSDYVSLHVPATAQTWHMIGAAQLRKMKPSAYLINTARGAIIDQAALAEVISAGVIAGAGLDVQDPEPPDLSQPLFKDERVIVTPHAAFVSEESLENLRSRVSQQVADWLHGKRPENVVNPEVLG